MSPSITIVDDYEPIYYSSASELLTDFIQRKKHHFSHWNVFRGERSDKFPLLPNALRKTNWDKMKDLASTHFSGTVDEVTEAMQIGVEAILLREFFKYANKQGLFVPKIESYLGDFFNHNQKEIEPGAFWIPAGLAEIASLAQHYGLYTRLLDWTNDFLVAAYFAANGATARILGGESLNSNLAIWSLDANFIERRSEMSPIKIVRVPYYSNENLKAQTGVFTLWSTRSPQDYSSPVSRDPLDIKVQEIFKNENYKGDKVTILSKLILPIREAPNLLSQIYQMGYAASKIFPGYSGVVLQMNDIVAAKRAMDLIRM